MFFFVNYWHGFHGILPIAGIIYREFYLAMIPMCSLCQSLVNLSSALLVIFNILNYANLSNSYQHICFIDLLTLLHDLTHQRN
jgi:hypothetical protein